ncbi:MAG: hypothetical protein AB8H86_15605 [Polyangiales bacterium]
MAHTHKGHGENCGCNHRPVIKGEDQSRWLPVILAFVACAFCPACVATYAKVLSLFGVGIGLQAWHHNLLLAVAVSLSLVVSGYRSWRSRRIWPLGVAALGSCLLLMGHMVHSLHALEWMGVAVLLLGGIYEQVRFRHRHPALEPS